MTIDSAFQGAVAALPTQRTAMPATLALPVPTFDTTARWQTAVAVLAGLLGGALMLFGVLLPW